MSLKCIDCILHRMKTKPDDPSLLAETLANIAVTVISGSAVCAGHLQKRLTEGAKYAEEYQSTVEELGRRKQEILARGQSQLDALHRS